MRVIPPNPDLSDRIEIITDPGAEPADLDKSLAEFLLIYVRDQSTPVDASTADQSQPNGGTER